MERQKRKRLEMAGWKVGTVRDLLNLNSMEEAFIEYKLALARDLQKRRRAKNLTQTELARLIQSSQSRVAKMEAGDPSVSVDLLVRSLLILGSSPKTLLRSLPQ